MTTAAEFKKANPKAKGFIEQYTAALQAVNENTLAEQLAAKKAFRESPRAKAMDADERLEVENRIEWEHFVLEIQRVQVVHNMPYTDFMPEEAF